VAVVNVAASWLVKLIFLLQQLQDTNDNGQNEQAD
jgi:hypothetical protein